MYSLSETIFTCDCVMTRAVILPRGNCAQHVSAQGFGRRYTSQQALVGVQALDGLAHSQAIGHAALRQYADYHLDHLGPYFPAVSGKPAIIPHASSFKDFVSGLKKILDKQPLSERAFDWIFSPHQILNKPHPNCGGNPIQQIFGHTIHRAMAAHTTEPADARTQSLPDCRLLDGVWCVARSNPERCSRLQKNEL